eukprot:gene5559-6244_t
MDISGIRELLDCPVCFERLRDNSKVLPCQHTFCRRCLKDVARTKGCVQCPECRSVFSNTDIDKLPPNVFLQRLSRELNFDKKERPQVLWKWQGVKNDQQPTARALYNFTGADKEDLSFLKGDNILLTDYIDQNWYEGILDGKMGLVPANFVEITTPFPSIEDAAAQEPLARSRFNLDQDEDPDYFSLKKGDVIKFVKRLDKDWCEGILNDRPGIFPLNHVELNAAAEVLVRKFSSSAVEIEDEAGPSEELSSATHSDADNPSTKRHTIHVNNPEQLHTAQCRREAIKKGRRASETAIQETIAKLSLNQNQPSSSSTNAINASQDSTATMQQQGTTLQPLQNASPRVPSTPSGIPNLHVCLKNYKAKRSSELNLEQGSIYCVTKVFLNGMLEGHQLGSQKSGNFPRNCVQPVSHREAPIRRSLSHNPSDNNLPNGFLALRERALSPSHSHSSSAPALMNLRALDRTTSSPPPVNCNTSVTSSSNSSNQFMALRRQRSGSEPPDSSTCSDKPKSMIAHVFSSFRKKKATSPPPPTPIQTPIPSLPIRSMGVRHWHPGPSIFDPPPPYTPPLTPLPVTVPPVSTTSSSSPPKNYTWYKATEGFPTHDSKELELKIGDLLLVSRKREDGWYYGKSKRTGKVGYFPSHFVELYNS